MRLYIYVAAMALITVVAGGLYLSGQHNARQAEQLQQADDYKNTRERIDDDLQNSRDGSPDWVERLRRVLQQ